MSRVTIVALRVWLRAVLAAAWLTSCSGCSFWGSETQSGSVNFDIAWDQSQKLKTHEMTMTACKQAIFEGSIGYFAHIQLVKAIDLTSGNTLWHYLAPVFGPLYSFEDYLVFASAGDDNNWSADRLIFLSKNGDYLGTQMMPGEFPETHAVAGQGRELYLEVYGGYITVHLDPVFPESQVKTTADWEWLLAAPYAEEGFSYMPNGPAFVTDGKIFLMLGYVGMTWVDYPPWPYSLSPLQEWYTAYPSRIVCLDQDTKELVWTLEHHGFGDPIRHQLFHRIPQGLLVGSGTGYLLLDPDSGEILWSAMEYGWSFNGGGDFVVDGLDVYQSTAFTSSAENNALLPEWRPYSLSKFTIVPGQKPVTTWGLMLPNQMFCNPLYKDGILYVLDRKNLSLYEASTGRFLGSDPRFQIIHGDNKLYRHQDLLLVNGIGETALRMNFKLDAQGRLYKE